MSQQDSVPFIARCTKTGERIEASTANDVVEFYRRRRRLTGGDVAWVFADHPAVTQAPDDGGLSPVLAALDEYFERGIPVGIVAAATSKQGWTVGETLDTLSELRMAGALWEPRDDHLRPV
ncbi:hypothetical protein NDI85_12630 [Halomicroarcula sp. S1AR25-4]|uniref:hypothetical protein n=1 Tax=Haloarcula sp. S1AR25-4 TaxID=2950538 RepID=UPI002875B31C|nr:hypothetical protein [Halomicroarcula sp. S1AR25-4]MDS0278645.1 hypothetical protein [Halomicroarcula sp. S1AR25-4]